MTGGEIAPIRVPLPDPFLVDISRDGTELLVIANREIVGSTATPSPLWIVPVLGGTPRPVGDLRVDDAGWSPDGRSIAYTVSRDVFLVGSDGSGSRKIWTSAEGDASYPAWAPDGRRLRLTVRNPQSQHVSLWEIESDGTNPHPLLPGLEARACCGRWTADGKRYVFGAGDDRTDLWLLPERSSWSRREPTPGPTHARPAQLQVARVVA